MNPVMPPVDPNPLPGPILLFKVLLWVTFSIHLAGMNLMLGGSLLAAVYGFKGKEKHLDAGRSMARLLPYAMPLAISFGVATLLFVQVLYGQLFYPATISIAAPFLGIIPVLIAVYYLAYLLSWRWERLGAWRPWISTAMLGLLLYVGYTFSSVFSLMLDPERVKAKYLRHPGGWQMNLAEPTLLPRFSHMFIGAVTLSGLYVAYRGLDRLLSEPDRGRWLFRSGATWFSGAVILQVVSGGWWLLDLPREQRMLVMGGDPWATSAFSIGVLAALSSLVLVLRTLNALRPWRTFRSAVACTGLTLVCMVIWRDILMDDIAKEYLDPYTLPTASHWGTVSLFLAIFLAGIAVIVWLLRMAHRAVKNPVRQN
jgi:hypothetical protein